MKGIDRRCAVNDDGKKRNPRAEACRRVSSFEGLRHWVAAATSISPSMNRKQPAGLSSFFHRFHAVIAGRGPSLTIVARHERKA